jgi:ribose/xylose/arabinose/galactoside ABC-type transport system permease subunit
MGTFTIVALGLTLVLVDGEIDLSVGAVYGLAAMVSGVLWVRLEWPLALALVVALGVAVAVGALNAFFTTVVKVPSFITTLGMLSLAQGVTFLVSGQSSVSASSRQGAEFTVFKTLGAYRLPLNIPIHIVWMIAAALIIGYLLHRTLFGFRVAAIGGNREAARVSGLPVRRYTFWVFMISGLCAGVAGILDFSFIGSTNPTAGTALTFPVFAAVIIGGASLSGGRGSVAGTLTGAFLLTMLSNGLSLLGVGTFAQLIFVGAVTIGAVALDGWATRRADPSRTLQM